MSTILLTFAVPDGTGSNRMLIEYAEALLAGGHHVVVAHGDSTAQSDSLPEAGLKSLARIAEAGAKCISCSGYRSAFSAKLCDKLVELVETYSVDAVAGFQQLDRKYAMTVAKRRTIPCIIGAFNKHTFWGPKPLAMLKRFLYGRMLRKHANLVVCSSEEVQQEIVGDFRMPMDRTVLVRNGLRIPEALATESTRDSLRESLGVGDDDLLFCNIARIDEQKGQDLLIEALADFKHEPWKLILVGNVSPGPNANRMEQFHQLLKDKVVEHQLDHRVAFLGWRDDLQDLLAATDVYIHPSRWEGWPLAVLHAMAEAKPIVTSTCVEPAIGFEEGTHGYTFENMNVGHLKEVLAMTFRRERGDFACMGAECRKLAIEHYDITKLGKQYVTAVAETIKNHQELAGAI